MEETRRLGFLLDVDDTLLDNDALKEYLDGALRTILGAEGAARFWALYEEVRQARDVVDLPLTAQRYGLDTQDPAAARQIDQLLDTVPFRRFLYPGALDTLRYLGTLGAVAILSDGDQVFQRRKIERSGIEAAVGGNVLIYTHKEEHLAEVSAFQPADHAVLIDDKARILAEVKETLGARVTVVHVLQGHYAREPLPAGFQPDLTVPAIGDLQHVEAARFWQAS